MVERETEPRPERRVAGLFIPIGLTLIVVAAIVGGILIAQATGDDDVKTTSDQADTTADDSTSSLHDHDHSPSEYGYFPLGTVNGRKLFRYGEGTTLISRWDMNAEPTEQQLREAEQLIDETTESILSRWQNVADAEADGYVRFDDVHWMRYESMIDGSTLDPHDPESLMYGQDPDTGEWILVSAMYIAPFEKHGEQVGGPATVWHFHEYDPPLCMRGGVWPLPEPADPATPCPPDSTRHVNSPEMLHVWIANPIDPFDHDMGIAEETLNATKLKIAEWNAQGSTTGE